jgi:hypothetical protein
LGLLVGEDVGHWCAAAEDAKREKIKDGEEEAKR